MNYSQAYPTSKQTVQELLFMENTTDKPQYASMSEVVMTKDELLKHLVENKAKHDVILAAAIAGYWDTAQTQLDTKKKRMDEQVDYYKAEVDREITRVSAKIAAKEELPPSLSIRQISIDTSLGLVYPQDHSKDYERAIRMMQSSVFNKVRLSANEYDAYVLNNWEWKANFIAVNSLYVTSAVNKKLNFAGRTDSVEHQGSAGYANAYKIATNSIMVSGCADF